jgi:hypothetical protein
MKKTSFTPISHLCADALNAEPSEWLNFVQSALVTRKKSVTGPEANRLIKQLQRLRPAAQAAISSSPMADGKNNGLAENNAQFQQTLRSLTS